MSLSNLKDLEAFHQTAISMGAVQSTTLYLYAPSSASYIDMCNNLFRAVVEASNNLLPTGFLSSRIVATLADGTVIFDSSKTNNSHTTAQSNSINSTNHNSRLSILTAAIGQQGVGSEKRISSTTGKYEQYLAHRVGKSPQDALGCIRYSFGY